MFPPLQDIYRLLPEFLACAFGILIMVVDPFVARARKIWVARLTFLGSVASLAGVWWMARHPGTAFSGLMLVDDFSIFLHLLIYAAAPLVILGAFDYLERENIQHGEFYALVLFATAGMGVMAGANELMTAFVGLEMSSIASYILAGFRRNALKSNESSMKYFLLGSFATAFFLYGVAMVYGATGTTSLQLLRPVHGAIEHSTLMVLGLGMIFVGLGFKVATAPFQLWTPDAYEGAPTPVTAMLSSAPKAAAFAVMLRVFFTAFNDLNQVWFWMIWGSAALTMFAGNLAALAQTNVKRMLAYSSIAHAGYIMVAFAASSELGIAAVLFYLVTYAVTKIGAFTLLGHLGETNERRLEIADYAGLGWKQPVSAAAFSLFLLSLLGLPATAGFLGKFYVFNAAVKSDLVWLAVLLAINSVIAAYYYLRVIVAMYFREGSAEWQPAPVPMGVALVLIITAAATVYLGLFPGMVSAFASQAALSLR